MNKKLSWSKEEISILTNMFYNDKSDKEIANELNLTIYQVKNKIRKLNLPKQHKRPTKIKNLLGQRFGKLVVKKRAPNLIEKSSCQKARWYCDCDCGAKDVLVTSYNLRIGKTKSCGCLARELTKIRNKESRTENKYLIDDKNKIAIGITSSGTKYAIDLEDLSKVRKYKWQTTQDGYIQAHDFDKNRSTIRLNRIIMNVQNENWINTQVDHINHDVRDNRKCNLRIATASENGQNKNCKCVSFHKASNKWQASAYKNGSKIYLGLYDTKNDGLIAVKKFKQQLNSDFMYENSMKVANQNGFVDFDKYIFEN